MLNLNLREEFRGRRHKGTTIELTNAKNTGAIDVAARDFLNITYPTTDVLEALRGVGPGKGRPLVLIGERGQGKSHLLGVLHHALTDPPAVADWLADWTDRLGSPDVANIPARHEMCVISESLHRQSYKFLWDLLFERHPHGERIRGRWEERGHKKSDVPGKDLLLALFENAPTALILDEFQTWYDGLTNTKQYPWRNWAFNFVQLVSEIAAEHPELLVLVVSIRNGNTDAFQQIQRVHPMLVDFKGPNAQRDRRRLLLHRLFENRLQIPAAEIARTIDAHVAEYCRLLNVPPAEHQRMQKEFVEAWPFAPHLLQLLEDQVLVATAAQETRDLIRILADLAQRHAKQPILTAADFRLDDDKSAVASLLDSVSSEHHRKLRERAQRNLAAVHDAVRQPAAEVPHLSEIVGALWLRSLAVSNFAGAEPAQLHVDVTRSRPIDDNAFQAELATIVENSFNIHEEGPRLVFRDEENPQTRLLAHARNDKLFADGSDHRQLAAETRYVLQTTTASSFRVVVLPVNWERDPWAPLDETDRPERWTDERIPYLVVPELPERLEASLGIWLEKHLRTRRNTVRFLLPGDDSENIYRERDLLVLARMVCLAGKWKTQSPEYRKLFTKYRRELQDVLKRRFPRYAVLDVWDYQHPDRCRFHVESHHSQGNEILKAVDEHISKNLFEPEALEDLVLRAADDNASLGKLLRELREPRPNREASIPWLGETFMNERILRLCARGLIALNVRNLEQLQQAPGEDEDTTYRRIRGKLGTGRHLDETYLLRPQPEPGTEGVKPYVYLGQGAAPATVDAPAGGDAGRTAGTASPDDTADPGRIFGDYKRRVRHEATPTSALNLLGRIESWRITPGTQLEAVTLTAQNLTGAQLEKLLKNLPDGTVYELSLTSEEEDEA